MIQQINPALVNLAVPIARLREDPKNARVHDDRNIAAITASLQEFGQQKPIVALRDGVVIAGNGTLRAAKALGWDRLAVVWFNSREEARARAYALADNRTAELATWDVPILNDILKDLGAAGVDIDRTLHFSEGDLNDLLREAGGDPPPAVAQDEVPELPKKPTTKPGDLWLLGSHRLMCGDSTRKEDVSRLLKGERAILFATDPPYLVDYDGTNHPHKWKEKSRNKDWSAQYGRHWDESGQGAALYDKFVAVALAEAIRPNAAFYCWHASRRQAMVEAVWEKHDILVHQQIIWVKDRPILTRSWFLWQHEPCFFGWRKGKRPPRLSKGMPPSTWQIPTIKPGTKTDHPTSKPVELFAIPMRQHTKPGDLCYEPFSGSGSQVIAAEQLGRRCYAMEIEPAFCDVTRTRWEKLTGKTAKRARA